MLREREEPPRKAAPDPNQEVHPESTARRRQQPECHAEVVDVTDARLPERWLSDRRLLRLSDSAFRLHIMSLMWTVTNRTDGQVDRGDLALIPRANDADVDRLVRAGLWQSTGSGWLLAEWDVTQTSRDELDLLTGMRRRAKLKKQRQRAKARDEEGTVSPGQSPVTVPGDGPPVPERQGKARQGKDAPTGGATDEDEPREPEPPISPSVGASLKPTPDPLPRHVCLDCGDLVPDGVLRHPHCQASRLRALGLVAS